MKASIKFVLVSFAALSAAACSFAARSPEMYAKDTQQVLETRSADIKKCYDEVLKTASSAAGKVTVKFTVKAETGVLSDVAIDAAGTTAPEAVSACVTTAIAGLTLAPPDNNDGIATYVWDFQVGAAPAVAAKK